MREWWQPASTIYAMATRSAGAPRSGCPINAAVEVIGDRWSLLVLRDIMFGNRRHFRVLQEGSEEGIASNILADRLRRLVSAGLLTRADAGRGHRVTYSLTEAAIQLVPVMAVLGEWGLRHRATTPSAARAGRTAGRGRARAVGGLHGRAARRASRRAAAVGRGRPRPSGWRPPTPRPSPAKRAEEAPSTRGLGSTSST